jgi:hypothetical protein
VEHNGASLSAGHPASCPSYRPQSTIFTTARSSGQSPVRRVTFFRRKYEDFAEGKDFISECRFLARLRNPCNSSRTLTIAMGYRAVE